MKLEQTPWNITEVFCISGNQKKGTPCIRKSEQRKPLHSIRTPSTFACLPHGVELEFTVQYFVSYPQTFFIFRAEVLSSELRLLISFSWSFFPWLSGPGSFLPTVFLGFGIRFQNGAKECIVQISASFQRVFTKSCKLWLRYSRELGL